MITVVTPTVSGRESLLAEAEQSVLAQTLQPVAHLVLLDENHEGPGPTLNKLISQVETDWYAVLNDDDTLDPDHLEAHRERFSDGDIVMSWGREPGRPFRGEFRRSDFLAKTDSGMRPGCYTALKSMWLSVGGYRDQPIEDWDLLARAIFRGHTVAPVYRETWTYRHHPGQSSRVYEAALAGGVLPDNTYHLSRWL